MERTAAEQLVARCYRVYLLREPDPQGHGYWVTRLTRGEVTADDVATSFVGSDEAVQLRRETEPRPADTDIATRCLGLYDQHGGPAEPRIRHLACLLANGHVRNEGELHRRFQQVFLRVRYCGARGSGGYCRAIKLYVRSLLLQGVAVYFDPLVWYRYNADAADDDDRRLDALTISPRGGAADEPFDVLVIHNAPGRWRSVIAEQRRRCAHTFVVLGVFAWETDRLPDLWLPDLRAVDGIMVPCNWNARVVRQALPETPVYVVPHVAEPPPSISLSGTQPLPTTEGAADVRPGDYMFYTINDWNGRKGIDDLLRCFHTCFTADDPVVLYVKTGGDISPADGQRFLAALRRSHPNPPRVVLAYGIVAQEQIYQIHQRGDCYVSLTKGEAVGLGLIEAAMWDKPVITTNHGGQREYLKGCMYVRYRLVPARYCLEYMRNHNGNSVPRTTTPRCYRCRIYDSATQKWAQPDLAHAAAFLRQVFATRLRTGDPGTKRYLVRRFSFEAVGQEFVRSLRALARRAGETK